MTSTASGHSVIAILPRTVPQNAKHSRHQMAGRDVDSCFHVPIVVMGTLLRTSNIFPIVLPSDKRHLLHSIISPRQQTFLICRCHVQEASENMHSALFYSTWFNGQ